MTRRREMRKLLPVIVLALVGVACGGGQSALNQERLEEMAALEELKTALDGKRGELVGARDQLETAEEAATMGADTAEGEEGGDMAVDPGALGATVEQLEKEVTQMTDDLGMKIVDYINSAGLDQGEELPEDVKSVIQMKSAEDIVIADEYITRGGDYRRALEIFTQALILDPDNADLLAGKVAAETDQYMTEDRFAQADKGMTERTVRQLLGAVNPRNIRDYPERDVIAWFYRKEDGGAAAVYFQKNKTSGMYESYKVDFTAVESEDGP